MAEADASPVARGLRWLTTVPATLSVCGLLLLVFAVERYVWTTMDYRTFVTLFVATPRPSPGWLLAPLAHLPTDPRHVLSSVAQLVVFGGLAEHRLGRREYLALLAVSGVATTAAQVTGGAVVDAGDPVSGTLGASGIALAATALVVVDSLRYRLTAGDWHGEVTWLWTLFGAFVVGRAALDLVVGDPNVGVVGHLTGIVIGLGFGLMRPIEAVLRSGAPDSAR
ncbi:MAG: rhomboid family intramembrane serine protease [Halosimplex sp.]